MVNWAAKTLYDRIFDRWMSRESHYSRMNTNREVIIRCFRSDETPTKGEERSTDGRNGSHRNMEFLGEDIYQGSGMWYSQLMATGFQGSLVSKNISWIRYQMEQFELKGIDELDVWVQDVKEHMTDAYTLSNFYDVQPQFTLDGLTIGSPLLFGEENVLEKRTMWSPQYYRNVRMYYDRFNQIEGVIVRDPRWTAKQIFDTFIGQDDEKGTKAEKKLTMAVNNSLKSGKLSDEYTVFRATFKVNDPIWNGEGFDKPSTWPWLDVYFLEMAKQDTAERNAPLNDNIGHFSKPFTHWDFDKKPWEAASRTPAWYAIWDCMGLQEVYKGFLENTQLKNRPPFYAVNSMKNRIALSPEGEMYVTNAEYDRPPQRMDLTGDIQMNRELSEIYEDALKRWFYIDRFQMFSDLVRTNKAPVATLQIWQMAGEKATLLSPAIETHSRYLGDADARMIDIEVRAGRGPFNPETMDNIRDVVFSNLTSPVISTGIQPVFIGPLAQAQKQGQALEPIQAGIEAITPLSIMFPDMPSLMIREYKAADHLLQATDFPQDSVNTEDEYNERKAALAESRAQEKAAAQAIEMAKAAPSVSGEVSPDSILAGATA